MADPYDKHQDPFAPPKVPCLVCCIHCGSTYDSWRIIWRDMPGEAIEGAWCCPIPGCDGIGFQFDIHPVDPDWEHSDSDAPFRANAALEAIEEEDDDDEREWLLDDEFDEDDEDAFDEEEDEDCLFPMDEFDENAFWIDPGLIAPRRLGNTPQPPFDRAPYGQASSSDNSFKDDDIPF